MDLGNLSRVEPVARFLRSPEDEVAQLVKAGRLGGAMVNALGQRGVSVTLSIKSSVESMSGRWKRSIMASRPTALSQIRYRQPPA